MAKNIFIIADRDMDGAGCILAARWSLPTANIKFITANEATFRDTFVKWWANADNRNDTDLVFICDLNVSRDHADILDDSKICIVDHHVNKDDVKSLYKRAALRCNRAAKSSTDLVLQLFHPTLDERKQTLASLIADYDSYTLSLPHSLDLNTVFFAFQGDKVSAFVNYFKDGFNGFSLEQQNIIKFHKLKLQETLNGLEVYHASITLDGVPRNIYSTFADYSVNDVARYLIDSHKADITLVINLKNRTVSFRKNHACTYDISKLAKQLVNGAGHENAAGGVISDKLLMFSKLFKKV